MGPGPGQLGFCLGANQGAGWGVRGGGWTNGDDMIGFGAFRRGDLRALRALSVVVTFSSRFPRVPKGVRFTTVSNVFTHGACCMVRSSVRVLIIFLIVLLPLGAFLRGFPFVPDSDHSGLSEVRYMWSVSEPLRP